MESHDPVVARNLAVIETYRLIGSVGTMLSRGNYDGPILQIAAHIRVLESLVATESDELILEDIAMLRDYQRVILDNRDNPFRAIKTWQEIGGRRY